MGRWVGRNRTHISTPVPYLAKAPRSEDRHCMSSLLCQSVSSIYIQWTNGGWPHSTKFRLMRDASQRRLNNIIVDGPRRPVWQYQSRGAEEQEEREGNTIEMQSGCPVLCFQYKHCFSKKHHRSIKGGKLFSMRGWTNENVWRQKSFWMDII